LRCSSKRGHYTLGAGPAPDLDAIGRAMRVSAWAAALWLLGAAGAGWALRAERLAQVLDLAALDRLLRL
jgi:hypothetical protein